MSPRNRAYPAAQRRRRKIEVGATLDDCAFCGRYNAVSWWHRGGRMAWRCRYCGAGRELT